MKPALADLVIAARGYRRILPDEAEIARMDAGLRRMEERGHHLRPDVEIDGRSYGYHHLKAVRDALVRGEPVYGRDEAEALIRAGGRGLHKAVMASDEAVRERRRREAGSRSERKPALSTLLAGRVPSARPSYVLLGLDDEVTVCEDCGKADLKCTVVLGVPDVDGNVVAEVRFGRDCAARALGRRAGRGAAEKIEKEARGVELRRLQAVAGRPDVRLVERGWTTAVRSPLPDGRYLVQQYAIPWHPARAWGGEWREIVPNAWWVGRPGGAR